MSLTGACDHDDGEPIPRGPGVFRSLASNRYGTCFVNDAGRAACWGYDTGGLQVPMDAPRFTQLSMTDYVTCGLGTDGRLLCWTGMGSHAMEPPSGVFTALDLGDEYGCALDSLGKITCWGEVPGDVWPTDAGHRSLSCGQGLCCAVTDDDQLECWGWGAEEYALTEHVKKVAVESHVCVILEDDSLRCLSDDPGDSTGVTAPPAGRYREVDVRDRYACAIDLAGGISCWGLDFMDRLSAPSGGGYTSLALGGRHGCALHESGNMECWGLYRFPYAQRYVEVASAFGVICAIDQAGALECLSTGDPAYDWNLEPPAGTGYEHVAMGSAHACALDAVGALTCFGDDSAGQLQAPAGTGWSAVKAGGATSCARRGEADWTCWGDTSRVPADTTGLRAIGLGGSAVCWVDIDGSAECAGDFVDQDEEGRITAVAPRGSDFVDIEVSSWNACALDGDGAVTCVGFGPPDGTDTSPAMRRYTALAVSGEDSWSFALREDGVVEIIGLWEPRLRGSFVSIAATAGQLCAVEDSGALVCAHPWLFDPR